jgi:hypothetical protein
MCQGSVCLPSSHSSRALLSRHIQWGGGRTYARDQARNDLEEEYAAHLRKERFNVWEALQLLKLQIRKIQGLGFE